MGRAKRFFGHRYGFVDYASNSAIGPYEQHGQGNEGVPHPHGYVRHPIENEQHAGVFCEGQPVHQTSMAVFIGTCYLDIEAVLNIVCRTYDGNGQRHLGLRRPSTVREKS